jgi:acetyltransferase-like isoleucine patch superfamily enzyme
MGLGLASLVARGMDRLGGIVQTRAARDVATLAPKARVTRTARIDNISGRKEAIAIGEMSVVAGHLQVFAHAGRISIGSWCFIGEGSHIWSAAEVSIGARVLISHGVNVIDTSSHPLDAGLRFAQTRAILEVGHPRIDPGLESAPIRIWDDAWISFGAAILRGVTVGEGAIVAACSVVTKDVEPWTVVGGNPARFIRRLDGTAGTDPAARHAAMAPAHPQDTNPAGGACS